MEWKFNATAIKKIYVLIINNLITCMFFKCKIVLSNFSLIFKGKTMKLIWSHNLITLKQIYLDDVMHFNHTTWDMNIVMRKKDKNQINNGNPCEIINVLLWFFFSFLYFFIKLRSTMRKPIFYFVFFSISICLY